jgi:CheY-like chemotaxis protein
MIGESVMHTKELGDLLVEANIITTKTLDRVLAQAQKDGKQFGTVLEEMGIITDDELVEALAKQLHIKVVKGFADAVFSESLLSLIPVDLAVQKLVFPIKDLNGILGIAVSDPFDTETIDFLAQKTGRKVLTALATRKEISIAINKHYLHGVAPSEYIKRILIIDDSEITSKIIQVALEKEGYEVEVAHDGLNGLKLAILNKPDLIICDLIMPRMDGYTFLRSLKAIPVIENIKVILLTAKATAEEEQKALEYGFFDFVPKPVQTIRVISRIKRAFELLN